MDRIVLHGVMYELIEVSDVRFMLQSDSGNPIPLKPLLEQAKGDGMVQYTYESLRIDTRYYAIGRVMSNRYTIEASAAMLLDMIKGVVPDRSIEALHKCMLPGDTAHISWQWNMKYLETLMPSQLYGVYLTATRQAYDQD